MSSRHVCVSSPCRLLSTISTFEFNTSWWRAHIFWKLSLSCARWAGSERAAARILSPDSCMTHVVVDGSPRVLERCGVCAAGVMSAGRKVYSASSWSKIKLVLHQYLSFRIVSIMMTRALSPVQPRWSDLEMRPTTPRARSVPSPVPVTTHESQLTSLRSHVSH